MVWSSNTAVFMLKKLKIVDHAREKSCEIIFSIAVKDSIILDSDAEKRSTLCCWSNSNLTGKACVEQCRMQQEIWVTKGQKVAEWCCEENSD